MGDVLCDRQAGLTSLDMAYCITDKRIWIAEPTAAQRYVWFLWLIRYLSKHLGRYQELRAYIHFDLPYSGTL